MVKTGLFGGRNFKVTCSAKTSKVIFAVQELQRNFCSAKITKGIIVKPYYGYFMRKAVPKHTWHSTSDKILKSVKNGHFSKAVYSKAICLKLGCFWSDLQSAKNIKKWLSNYAIVVFCKKLLEETLNIRKMTRF